MKSSYDQGAAMGVKIHLIRFSEKGWGHPPMQTGVFERVRSHPVLIPTGG